MNNIIKDIITSLVRITLGVIIITGVFFFTITNAQPLYKGVSPAEAMEIYKNLVIASGESDVFPQLTIVDDPTINAYAYSNPKTGETGIVILTGMLDAAKSKNEIALILGHEMAHYTLEHIYPTKEYTKEGGRKMELQADKYGGFIMMKAGYDICDGRNIFITIKELTGDYVNATHPSNAYRYDQLNINCGD